MADILNASPALLAPSPFTSRGDESRIRENSGSEAEPAATVPFAAVLKSRSDQLASGGAAKAQTAKGAATAAAVAPEGNLATQAINATALFSKLGNAATDTDVAVGDAAALAAASAESLIAGDALSSAALPLPNMPPTGEIAEESTVSTAPTIDAFTQAATDASILVAAPAPAPIAVAPAPTSSASGVRGEKPDDTAQRSARSTDVPLDRKATADKLAVDPAISAETARAGSQASASSEGAADFRSTLDRIANHSGNLAVQANGTTPATPTTPSVRVETGFGQSGWHQEMGEKLSWMVGNGRQQADLVLNPPQLGRIEVTMVIEGDNVSATFASANATVREVLENSMSRLREVLADAGVALGDTHVGAECRQDGESTLAKGDRSASGHRLNEVTLAPVNTIAGGGAWRVTSGRGMVDIFA